MTPDPYAMLDLVILGLKPAYQTFELSPPLIRKSVLANLERHFFIHENTRYCIFGLPEKMAASIALQALEKFENTKYISGIDSIIEEIKDMTVAKALLYFIERLSRSSSPEEGARIKALTGILFGYPPCCINYFLERKYENKRHAYENEDGVRFYLRCERCSRESTWASWCPNILATIKSGK